MIFPFLTRRHGVLGLNARNLLYMRPYNPKKAVAFADDKLKTKAFLSARRIPVAKIYARIEDRRQLREFDFSTLPDECVLKPNYGYGGEGILILKGRRKGEFLEEGKRPITERRLREHIEDILDGRFSINGKNDTAFFEKILTPHPAFAPFRPAGLPDVRIVVFNLVPVMAMLRVPTAESGGKANVHLGGIGIGIDITKGVTTYATQYHHLIRILPHGVSPSGIQIPYWDELLLHAARIQYITNIGYLAVDLTLDRDQGPVLLEVNARAGLMVQVANLAGLRTRLERVEGVKVTTPEKGVRLARDLFGHRPERPERRETVDRPILGLRETITVSAEGASMEVSALVSPMLTDRSIFTPDLLRELERAGGAERQDEGLFHVKFTLGGRRLQTLVQPGTVPLMSVRAVIGRRDLQGFLIDPAKEASGAPIRQKMRTDLRAFDRILADMDQDLLLLKYLKPMNLAEERARLETDRSYSPLFSYPDVALDLDDMTQRMISVDTDDSPLGIILAKKRRELLERMAVLQSRGNAEAVTRSSAQLFGLPQEPLLSEARAFLSARAACDLLPPATDLLNAQEAAPLFEEAFLRYGLHDWQVLVRGSVVADCSVGWKELYLREGALFSREHIASLIVHEVETHILTVVNGDHQPFEIFRRGFADYLDTQEGLAVFHQNRVLSPFHEKRYGPARSFLAVAYALTHSFVDTRRHLEEQLGYAAPKALTKAIELKRGLHDPSEPGCFTKGIVYFRGQRRIERFVSEGGDLRRLYVGKVAIDDLDLAEQVPGVQPALLLPEWLREKQ
ncbi:MAG: Uncharacterized protein Greene041619_651 [Candidatus Peregrinibacteria bacterium Greene0416_19]|nr:MAG: Uncharacterized protein Greene041619_651 [Candidatus Peregrinibacteria bacterium Greene0416_19]